MNSSAHEEYEYKHQIVQEVASDDRPLTAPGHLNKNLFNARLSNSLPGSLLQYRNKNLKKKLQPFNSGVLDTKSTSDNSNESKTEESPVSPTRQLALTKEHIIAESKEVLSWIPLSENKEDKSFVVLHYRSLHSPLFDTMQLVRGQIKSNTFIPDNYGFDTSRFRHRDFPPNTSDRKKATFEEKESVAYLKDAKVIIPVCYGVDAPIDGKSIANIAKSYIVHHGAAEVIVYLGRYSDPKFKIPEDQLQATGERKKQEWLMKHKPVLTPKNLQDTKDYLHKVKILEREKLIKEKSYVKADRIFSFFLSAKKEGNDLLKTIEKDVASYNKKRHEKDTAKTSPIADPTPKRSSSGRLLQDTFELPPSAYTPEVPPLPTESLEKICKLSDEKDIEQLVTKIAFAQATYMYKFHEKLRFFANQQNPLSNYVPSSSPEAEKQNKSKNNPS